MKLKDITTVFLKEERNPEVRYTEEKTKGVITKVIAHLEAQKSSAATKLAKKFLQIDRLTKRLSVLQKETNENLTNVALNFFDDTTDIFTTRLVETASYVITVNKNALPTQKSKTDYEALYNDISKLVGEELQPKLEELFKTHTKEWIEEPKKPGMKVAERSKVDESLSDTFKAWKAKIESKFKNVLASIKSWASSYDKKLAAIKKQYQTE